MYPRNSLSHSGRKQNRLLAAAESMIFDRISLKFRGHNKNLRRFATVQVHSNITFESVKDKAKYVLYDSYGRTYVFLCISVGYIYKWVLNHEHETFILNT